MSNNASLIIGDGKWATKDGSLLGYKITDNDKYLPKIGSIDRDCEATTIDRTGTLVTAANNVARIDFSDNPNGAMLLEPQATNLIPYSEDFSQASWIKSKITINPNQYNSVTNTNDATQIIEDSTIGQHALYIKNLTTTASIDYTFSTYVKPNGRNLYLRIISNDWSDGCGVRVDFDTKTLTSQTIGAGNYINATIKEREDGYFNISITGNIANTNLTAAYYLVNNTSDTYQGDGTSGIYVWGAQLEQGSVATSYIPTSGSSEVRLADEPVAFAVTPTTEGAIVNSDFVQQYATNTPNDLIISSKTSRFMKFDSQLTAQQISDLGVTEAVFLTEFSAAGNFNITVSGTGTVYWGDGTSDTYDGTTITLNHTFTKVKSITAFVGTLTYFKSETSGSNAHHDLASLPSGLTYYSHGGQNTTSGDIGNLPSGLTSYNNQGQNTTSGNLADLPSGLTFYLNTGQNTTTGDIANLPSGLTYYNNQGQNQVNQYTSGRVWNSSISYFLSRPASGYGLTSAMVDNLLIDLDASGMSSGTIYLDGNNAARTSASDAAVTSLQGKGVTVTTN